MKHSFNPSLLFAVNHPQRWRRWRVHEYPGWSAVRERRAYVCHCWRQQRPRTVPAGWKCWICQRTRSKVSWSYINVGRVESGWCCYRNSYPWNCFIVLLTHINCIYMYIGKYVFKLLFSIVLVQVRARGYLYKLPHSPENVPSGHHFVLWCVPAVQPCYYCATFVTAVLSCTLQDSWHYERQRRGQGRQVPGQVPEVGESRNCRATLKGDDGQVTTCRVLAGQAVEFHVSLDTLLRAQLHVHILNYTL